jgi:DNA/RNA-binding domain of Phe-tRNA-synthetase-like protein
VTGEAPRARGSVRGAGDGWVGPKSGFVAADVAAELPGLRLDWMTVATPGGRHRSSPPAVVKQLGHLASRYRGATVVTMRTKPIPHAYRAFYRQIGLDPDVERIPAERAAVQRLLDGGFRSVDLITDACLIALLETAIPVWALDADAIASPGLGIRTTTAEDARTSAGSAYLDPGSLAVADGDAIHALLFADPLPAATVGARTTRVALFSVAVDGVPRIHVEEALWMSAQLLGGGDPEEC